TGARSGSSRDHTQSSTQEQGQEQAGIIHRAADRNKVRIKPGSYTEQQTGTRSGSSRVNNRKLARNSGTGGADNNPANTEQSCNPYKGH
ncbi:unnamed protein product, partial [Staurois parvus]